MLRLPPRSTRTATPVPSTGFVRSVLIYASRFLDPFGNLATLRPDGRQLARLADGRLSILDPRSSFELYSLDGHNGAPIAFAFDQTDRHLLSGGSEGDLLVWKLPEPERAEFASSVPHADGAPLAFSPGGERFFFGERGGGGALWGSARRRVGEEGGS